MVNIDSDFKAEIFSKQFIIVLCIIWTEFNSYFIDNYLLRKAARTFVGRLIFPDLYGEI